MPPPLRYPYLLCRYRAGLLGEAMEQDKSFACREEVENAVPVPAMTDSQLPELLFEMPGIRHCQINPEFLKQVESPGYPGSRLRIQGVNEFSNRDSTGP